MQLQRLRRHTATICLWLFTITCFGDIHANPDTLYNEVTIGEVETGSILLPLGDSGRYMQIPAVDTDIEIEVTGMLAQHDIHQTFSNPSDEWLEAIYVYPLPDSATVDELTMVIGDQRIVGEIQTRADARKNYTIAKNNGQRASLVERQRANLFTTRVANIPPHGAIKIEIGFQADVRYDDGIFGLSLPLTITPRYIPGNQLQRQNRRPDSNTPIITSGGWGQQPGLSTDQTPDAYEITPPMTTTIPDTRLNIILNSGISLDRVYSPSHQIVAVQEDLIWRVSIPTQHITMDRDFTLQWQPLPGTSPLAAVFTQQTKANDKMRAASFASLMLVPPQQLFDSTVPSREVIFVIDKSGSMDGSSLIAAKEALILGIQELSDNDTFNVVIFNNQTTVMFNEPIIAIDSGKRRAVSGVRNIRAGGGTEIMGALKAALATSSNSERVRQIVFITDGSVGNEAAIFKHVQSTLGQNRIFTVGIGSAPNRWFMRKTAELGRGTYTYISDSKEVSEKMRALFHKLKHPVLSNVKLQFNGVDQPEYYPQTVPDLYAGEPVLVDVRSVQSLAGTEVMITGDENGLPWSRTLRLDNTANNGQSGLDKLWARRKITDLENSLLFSNDEASVEKQATDTALSYGLVTRYTSLVAIEQEITRSTTLEPLTTKEVPLPIPAGSTMKTPKPAPTPISQTGPDGDSMPIPQGNLGIVMHLLMSLVMSSSVAVGAWLTRRRKHAQI